MDTCVYYDVVVWVVSGDSDDAEAEDGDRDEQC